MSMEVIGMLRNTGLLDFFRVERIGNRWWMIDPDGYRHLQKVVVGVRLGIPNAINKRCWTNLVRKKNGSKEQHR